MRKLAYSAALVSVLLNSYAFAQEAAPQNPSTTPPTASASDSDISFSGYLEGSYNYLSKGSKFTSGTPSRAFDTEKNGFSLQQLAFTLSKLPKEGLGGLVSITAGKDADVLNSFGWGDGTNNNFDVTQVYAQYATGPFTIIGGKFVTLAGAEVNNSVNNMQYSRSYLFELGPYTHTGVRGTYAVNDTLNVIAGVNRGWDVVQETNTSKTLELGVAYTPSKKYALNATLYTGKERVGGWVESGPEGTRNLFDVVGTYNATDKLSFIVDAAYGSQANTDNGTAKWGGIAGYTNYQINDKWRISGRLEYFDDKDGYRTGVQQKLKEGTVTLAYLPTKAVELRTEVRADRSNVASFADGNDAGKSQYQVAVQALYKF